MTPAQLLQRTPALPPPTVVESGFVPDTNITNGAHYTSEAMEEDFSIAVEMLMKIPDWLRLLQSIDDEHNSCSSKVRDELHELVEEIQEFTGQWIQEEA